MKRVEVYWDDAWHSQSDHSQAKARKMKPHPTKSVGYLLKNDDVVCVIAQSVDNDKKVSEVLVIPAGMVTGLKELG